MSFHGNRTRKSSEFAMEPREHVLRRTAPLLGVVSVVQRRAPVDVEGVLEGHPAVQESAVVGVPDPLEQELPRAYVVLRPGASATEEQLCQFVQERAAPHKWLRGGVVFLKELPKTSTGKINRAAVRKKFGLEQQSG